MSGIVMNYWLLKSEPSVFGIQDLERDQTTVWDGVRNYQARNYLKQMQLGDHAFFYHSNTDPPGIVGLSQIVETQVVDPSQFDPASDYWDPKATPEAPRWFTVKVGFVCQFAQILSLDQLRQSFTEEELVVVKRGTRLSVMPVETSIAHRILALAGSEVS